METCQIDEFVKAVVYDHSIATGLKSCTTQNEIVLYAKSQNFHFTLEDWKHSVDSYITSLHSEQQEEILQCDSSHWSWAFRQTAAWRAMLM